MSPPRNPPYGAVVVGQTHIPRPASRWFVRVDGDVYGPFTDQTLYGYMREGRITAQSFVSQDPRADFRQVAAIPPLAHWLTRIETETPAPQQPVAEPLAEPRTCLVMAEIRSGRSMAFLQALQALGDTHRVGDTLWVVRTLASPEDAVGVLSPPLAPEDRLFVVDASTSARASFNLGQSVDGRLQDLFDGPAR